MIHIFCTRASDGARELVDWINDNGGSARRLREFSSYVQPGDLVVNWGSSMPRWPAGVRTLNNSLIHNKFSELSRLAAARVPVPEHSQRREVASWGQPGGLQVIRGAAPAGEWLARRFGHQEANDLLANLREGDYYVRYVPTVREFRIHVFGGQSIRSGLKVPRLANPNPRFRSWSAGWGMDYGRPCQESLRQSVRDTAKAAVAALGYDFGAVDIGVRADGSPLVFEVNSAPGLEGNTLATYGRAIIEAAGQRQPDRGGDRERARALEVARNRDLEARRLASAERSRILREEATRLRESVASLNGRLADIERELLQINA